MFNRLNKMKVNDIKKLHNELEKNQFLRIFLKNGIYIDLFPDNKFEINNDYITIDKLKAFTKDFTLYDILTIIEE